MNLTSLLFLLWQTQESHVLQIYLPMEVSWMDGFPLPLKLLKTTVLSLKYIIDFSPVVLGDCSGLFVCSLLMHGCSFQLWLSWGFCQFDTALTLPDLLFQITSMDPQRFFMKAVSLFITVKGVFPGAVNLTPWLQCVAVWRRKDLSLLCSRLPQVFACPLLNDRSGSVSSQLCLCWDVVVEKFPPPPVDPLVWALLSSVGQSGAGGECWVPPPSSLHHLSCDLPVLSLRLSIKTHYQMIIKPSDPSRQ